MDLPREILSALAEGRQAHIALETPRGPHITPELYAWSDEALWMLAAATTLKLRVLRDGSRASMLVRLPGRQAVFEGPVDLFDPRRPLDLVKKAAILPKAVTAAARFALRNSHDAAAFFGDTLAGKLGPRLPALRVFFAMRPERAALIEGGATVRTWRWGREVRDLPAEVRMPTGGKPAAVAFPGPLALPARWFEEEQRVYISSAALALLAEVDRFVSIAVVIDEYNAPGPAAKSGRLLRGTALQTERSGYFDIVDADVTEWAGVETT